MQEPRTLDEVSEIVREAPGAIVHGIGLDVGRFGLPTMYRNAVNAAQTTPTMSSSEGLESNFDLLSLKDIQGIVEWYAEDHVVRVGVGSEISAVNVELGSKGQCIPWAGCVRDQQAWHLGQLIQLNLPHGLERQCGSWRDWVLGMTIVRADGTVAKCGSRAVKNVAGYDVQKLLIGDRGTLGVVVEVTLRTYPAAGQPDLQLEYPGTLTLRGPICIQRVVPSDLDRAVESAGDRLKTLDRATATLWCDLPVGQKQTRFAGDWILRAGAGRDNLEFTDPTQIRLMKRTKDIFDPTHKLNPGEMGIF